MAAALRQEWNLFNGGYSGGSRVTLSGTGTVTCGHSIKIEPCMVSDPVVYLEVVASASANTNTGTIRLGRSAQGDTNVSSTHAITMPGPTSTTPTVLRSDPFNLGSTTTIYRGFIQSVGDGVRTQTIYSARLVMLYSSASQIGAVTHIIELGNQEGGKSNTVAAPLSFPKYWKYVAANWDSGLSFNVFATYATSAKNTVTITLQEDNGSGSGWTDKVTIVNAGSNTNTAPAGYGEANFTPVDGRSYRISSLGSTSKSTYTIYGAYIRGVRTTYSDIVNTFSTFYDINGIGNGGGKGEEFVCPTTGTLLGFRTGVRTTNGPTDSLIATIATSLNGPALGTATVSGTTMIAIPGSTDHEVQFKFSPPVQVTAGTNYFIRVSRTGGANSSIRFAVASSSTSSPAGVAGLVSSDNGATWGYGGNHLQCSIWIMQDSNKVTKCEEQYMSLTGPDSNVTGVQTALVKYNSAEWDAGGGTVTFKVAMDSDNASNSIKLRDTTNSADLTNSTVTGSGHVIGASALSLTNGSTIDTWVLNTTGTVAGSRIIAYYSYAAPAGGSSDMYVMWICEDGLG